MSAATYQFYNPEYLESLIGDDVETKSIVLSTLLIEVPAELQTLKNLLREKDLHNFHLVSHKLKSTLAYIGDDVISDKNNEMMLLARNNSELDKLPDLWSQINGRWSLIEPEVKFALSQLSI